MTGKNRIIGYFFTVLTTILILLTFTLSSNAQTLYSCVSPDDGAEPLLRIINPNTGATISTLDLNLPGVDIKGCNGLAKDPTTGTCYMMISTPNTGGGGVPGARILAVLNQSNGSLIEVGNTGQRFAGIAFDNGGQLFGLTGDQFGSGNPINPTTLLTINKFTGESTIFLPLVSDADGEALGFNPIDRLLYRLSRVSSFQSIDPVTKAVTTIPLSGDSFGETTALTHLSSGGQGNVLLFTDRSGGDDLFSITTAGVVSFIGEMDHESKGLAFDCDLPPEPIPTLNEWGLIAMAGILGIVGFMVIRRRKVTA